MLHEYPAKHFLLQMCVVFFFFFENTGQNQPIFSIQLNSLRIFDACHGS